MANWYGTARSSYFHVVDEGAFAAAIAGLGEELGLVFETKTGDATLHMVYSDNDDSGGWPTSIVDEESGEYEDFEVSDFVASHLPDGEVAVFMEVGAEKMRYVTGHAFAINNKGESVSLDLNGIYDLAKSLGTVAEPAEY